MRALVTTGPVFAVQRGGERAHFDHGWLKTYHSFSFAAYHDPNNVAWGALRVLNDDHVAPGSGFPMHPHAEMEIITYVLEGELEHRDSTGSHGIVGPGGVQYMSAGTGVRHSEFNRSNSAWLHFIQMWLLPGRSGGLPSYGQLDFNDAARRNTWLVLASGRSALPGAVTLTQDASLAVTRLEQHRLYRDFEPQRLGFLFVAAGSVNAKAWDSNERFIAAETLSAGDAVRIAGMRRIEFDGSSEIVLWDVPPL
jgi:redox-sensitive bicupin YhaK (pirin superfamily)